MQEVGLNKAEVDAITRLEKAELICKLKSHESKIVSKWILKSYPEASESRKLLINTLWSAPSFGSEMRNPSGTPSSLLKEALNLEMARVRKYDPFEIKDVTSNFNGYNIELMFPLKNVSLVEDEFGRLPLFARYVRRVNVNCIRNNIPAKISIRRLDTIRNTSVSGRVNIDPPTSMYVLSILMSKFVSSVKLSDADFLFDIFSKDSFGVINESRCREHGLSGSEIPSCRSSITSISNWGAPEFEGPRFGSAAFIYLPYIHTIVRSIRRICQ